MELVFIVFVEIFKSKSSCNSSKLISLSDFLGVGGAVFLNFVVNFEDDKVSTTFLLIGESAWG
jgi:hypothetical protein